RRLWPASPMMVKLTWLRSSRQTGEVSVQLGWTQCEKVVILARAITAVEKRMQPARYGRASAGHFDTHFLHPVSAQQRNGTILLLAKHNARVLAWTSPPN